MAVLTRLFVLATIALTAAQAQSSQPAAASAPASTASASSPFKETYPSSGSVPTPKPEWMELIKSANITNAPVVKSSGDAGPQQSGDADPYCDWTFTGCTRPDDVTTCPKGQWGITYDDGPTQYTSKLYDFLDQKQQKATLFMIGGQVVQFPDLVKRAYNTGHELAMHTWSHSYLTTQTNEQIVAELKWTELAIKEVTGVSPRFFRPPYGDIDDRVRDIAKALGFVPVIWDHDTDDWMAGESKTFDVNWIDGNATQWATEAGNSQTGGISLEHDLYQQTVDAAIRILPTLQKAYKVTTVGACSGQQSYKEGGNNATTSASATSSAAVSSAGAASSGAGAASSGAGNSADGSAKSSADASSSPQGESAGVSMHALSSSLVAAGLASAAAFLLA
ncbi:hypothetical protein BCR43DRAFT_523752 [Syncephalastrum racemosum]|uniref:NodB homology domain-containing protein n=1 Tax=Syncephalastrum racemosum TaxID=13706 RepID=A0A1X2HFC7_SYNRA|nr:hypothetical protein BCR43DRAFT_523752 [Syncephalastrum racemosum]